MNEEHYDVIIVGAGVAGAVAGLRLAQAGMRVVCLEQGDWPDYSLARGDQPDFELTATRDWAWDPNARHDRADYPVDEAESDMTVLMWNGVGGSSVIYAAQWQRNHPSDFRTRTEDGVGDDWPMGYEELRPYYERVERQFGISGRAGDPAFPPGDGPPLPPAPLGVGGRRVAEAHNALGWHWWPGANAIATRPYGPLGACEQLGACCFACPRRAKGTVDITHWPQAVALGAQLRTGARVSTIELDARGRVSGVVYRDRDDEAHRVTASVTILAANGIGTPRLLLMSASKGHPDGLANSSGLVGRRLMLHPFANVAGTFDEPLDSWRGVWGQHLYSLEFYRSDPARGFVRGAKWGLTPTGGPVFASAAPVWGQQPAWGAAFHRNVQQRLGRSLMWGIICEDLPDVANQVSLDPDVSDSDGLPGVRIRYRLDDNSRAMIDFNVARAEESLRAAGARSTVATVARDRAWHLLGTATMGDDPATSVVDAWGRCHDVPNLYIFDGSIWPTSSGMNPTATIAAIALRNTEALIDRRHQQAVAMTS